MLKICNFITILSLMFLNLLAISSSSIIMLWMFSELSTYLFISMSLSNKMKTSKTEFPLIYLIISFTSSTILLLTYLMHSNDFFYILSSNSNMNNLENILISISFLIKLGMIPFHSWVFSILSKMNWNSILILSTMQKIIPIWGISFIMNSTFSITTAMISSFFILFMPLKSNSIFSFLAISSIMNMTWILITASFSFHATIFFTIIYFLLLINIISLLKIYNLKSFFYLKNKSIIIITFSLIGIPPLLGFFPKMNSIILLMNSSIISSVNISMILLILITSTSIVSYMYMKMLIPSLLELNNKSMIMKNKNNEYMKTMIINVLSPILILMMEIIM